MSTSILVIEPVSVFSASRITLPPEPSVILATFPRWKKNFSSPCTLV